MLRRDVEVANLEIESGQGTNMTFTVQEPKTTGFEQTRDSERREYIRVLPPFVVDLVLEATLLVVVLIRLYLSDLGLIEQLMMKAEDLLILLECGFWSCCRCHVRCVGPKPGCWCSVEKASRLRGKGETAAHVSHTAAFSTRRATCLTTMDFDKTLPDRSDQAELADDDLLVSCAVVVVAPYGILLRTDQNAPTRFTQARSALRLSPPLSRHH